MDDINSDLYAKLRHHLGQYRSGQTTRDAGLLSSVRVDIQSRPGTQKSLVVIQECLATIEASAQIELHDARTVMPMVVELAKSAIALSQITFDHIRTAVGLGNVLNALASPSFVLIDIALDCIQKATRPSDASLVGSHVGLVDQIVRTWLQIPDTRLSERALDILLFLLKADDSPELQEHGVSGLVWRRIFADPRLYEELFLTTSNTRQERPSDNSRFVLHFDSPAIRSVRQGRLFAFVLATAKLHYDKIAVSNHRHIEILFRRDPSSSHGFSLLDYVTNDMCDEDDELIDLVRYQFLTSFLEIRNPLGAVAQASTSWYTSPSLAYLERSQIHISTINRYLQLHPSSTEGTLFQDSYIQYISTYFRTYPHHALATNRDVSQRILDVILARLNVPRSYWSSTNKRVPRDLIILQEMPLPMLFEGPGREAYQTIPANPANPSALGALSRLFQGHHVDISTEAWESSVDYRSDYRKAGSRLLFFSYLHAHPDFWANLAAAISLVTDPTATKQAIDLARGIATANWQELPEGQIAGNWRVPGESEKKKVLLFRTGLAAVLMTGSQVWQALLAPVAMPKTNAAADASSIHWDISVTKFETLEDILQSMEKDIGRSETDATVWASAHELLIDRIRDWHSRRAIINPEIQTMEL